MTSKSDLKCYRPMFIIAGMIFLQMVTLDSRVYGQTNPQGQTISQRRIDLHGKVPGSLGTEGTVGGAQAALSQSLDPGTSAVGGDAYQIFQQLQRSLLLGKPFEVAPEGNTSLVTFGAEKEGSSAVITRIFGPDTEYFMKIFDNLAAEDKVKFGRQFIGGLKSKAILAKEVTDAEGRNYVLDLNFLKSINENSLDESKLKEVILQVLQRTENQVFSFLNPATRVKLFNGTFPGLRKEQGQCFRPFGRTGRKEGNIYSTHWNPLLGKPQKYLSRIEGQVWVQGWEFHLKPQNSYQEFEEALEWLKTTLRKKIYTMTAPGHHRVVIPYPANYAESRVKIADLARLLQIYVVLEGIAGQTGIEAAAAKNLQQDSDLIKSLTIGQSTGRGVLRLEPGRFGDSLGIEFRAGTKDQRVQQFILQVAVAYIASGDYSSLESFFGRDLTDSASSGRPQGENGISKWSFGYKPQTANEIATRFNVDLQTASKYIENVESVVMQRDDRRESRYKKEMLYLPLWSWETLPFLSADKKQRLLSLGARYIKMIAQRPPTPKRDAYRLYLSDWVRHSNLPILFRNILQPKPKFELPDIERLVPEMAGIDLGLEQTTQYPEKNVSRFVRDAQGSLQWQETIYDLTSAEKSDYLKKVAEVLMMKLGSDRGVYTRSNSASGHGHGLDTKYYFLDTLGREWIVEWDGIGRSYDEATGEVRKETLRGGHIEIVSPKFQPKQSEIEAIFSTFNELTILPKVSSGGGHLSFDLRPFANNPRAFARFILLFLKHRSVIAAMFQSPERFASAEAHDVSAALWSNLIGLAQKKDLTENELKLALYNGGFFNTRKGRKTKYTQLDASAYFQDVIPEDYITGDFDIKSPEVEWKLNFDVDPRVRKAELRIFDAAGSPNILKMQVLLLRALFKKAFSNEALNVDAARGFGYTSLEAYNQEPMSAYEDLESLVQDLGLSEDLYSAKLTESLTRNRHVLGSNNYQIRRKNHDLKYPKVEFKKVSIEKIKAPSCIQVLSAA